MTIIKNKIVESFIIVSIFILVFIFYIFPNQLSFYDEFFALIFAVLISIIVLIQKKIYLYKEEKTILILLFFIAVWGLLSNYFTLPQHVTITTAIISDFIVVFKAYIAYFGIRLIKSQLDSQKVLESISYFAEISFYILFLLVIIDVIFDLFPKEPRYGMESFKLFFNHPSRFSFAFSFAFLAVFHTYIGRKKWFLFLILLVGLLSLRVKYFGFVTISFAIFYFKDYLKRIPRKQFYVYIFIAFSFLYLIFRDQINFYFSLESLKTGWSRAVLLVKSIEIGNDFFPFGTGFGTYASYFSGKYYSWVYELYDIEKVYGITKKNPMFIADQFWPMVLGQFGYPGLIAYILLLYKFIMLFLKLLKEKTSELLSQRMIVALLGLFLLIIDSSSDAIFTQDRAVVIFTFIALIVNVQTKNTAHVEE